MMNKNIRALIGLGAILLMTIFGCGADDNKNEVIVLGTVHGKHLSSKVYGLEVLRQLIREIKPDIILTEIPPDRMDSARIQFETTGEITEARVSRFPEYVDVIFPLTKEMEFEIIPTAGWTKEMSDKRSAQLKGISKDSTRSAEWNEYLAAAAKSDSMVALGKAKGFDPYFIHTQEYDDAVEIWAETYNRLFNEELGPGGWDNINEAHYGYIAEALNKHTLQGKRVLITYGAGHKGWFLRALKKREDIRLLEVAPFLDKLDQGLLEGSGL